LITRVFSELDQTNFASISGDYNPMHMDALAARRTPAGAPVVHGVQSMLWALDVVAGIHTLDRLSKLDADFARFLHVGEEVTLGIVCPSDKEIRAELRSDKGKVASYVLRFEERQVVTDTVKIPLDGTSLHYTSERNDPIPMVWEDIAASNGVVTFYRPAEKCAELWPNLVSAIGAERVAGILAMTRLVGMVSPGLHSTFHRIGIQLIEESRDFATSSDALHFTVRQAEPRFQVVTFSVQSPGVQGTLKASRRTPPTEQPTSDALRSVMPEAVYAGHTALVVGGSRGIGEVTAKLLGLAGVRVIISYVVGAADAEAVATDIREAGGQAITMKLDVLGDVDAQLDLLPSLPQSLYYFATRRIGTRNGATFDSAIFKGFYEVYVRSFEKLCVNLAKEKHVHAFFPSTVYVDDHPRGLAEYAMAKAAGEVLSRDMTLSYDRLNVHVARLPRLPTDQTAGMIDQISGSVVESLLPIIHQVEGAVSSRT